MARYLRKHFYESRHVSGCLPVFGSSEPQLSGIRGMALLLCLLMISMLCLIGGAALSVSGLNRMIVHNAAKQARAFYLAEAGREAALARLKRNLLWRGDEETAPSSFQGELDTEGIRGAYAGTLSDCTDDANGIYDALLPPGHVLVTSLGSYLDAVQTVSCLVSMVPGENEPAAFPQKAVVSAGAVTGSIKTLNQYGIENSSLLLSNTTLPEANTAALKAFADAAFSSLDNETYDAVLGGVGSFWRDSPADTRPRIVYVRNDLDISGDRKLYGIIFVDGDRVEISGHACFHGILYAPHANRIAVENAGASDRVIGTGQIAAGPGGVQVTGNPVSVQLHHEYVDSFNEAAGLEADINMVSGSWRAF